ncbi:Hypothetical protein, putative [Bodo saltans]|uniref:Uncharacterized protein n=1 Tax=Bodo saltans TaxID=75058 RepID=A0A0S4J5A7_BODSA|nr:Hypothetical protein, putative [Bodo saltans]|eukprot:CUG57926.1 Hypothetical protein, putative [Bodo saltans]
MISLTAFYSSLQSLEQQEEIIRWICRENLLNLTATIPLSSSSDCSSADGGNDTTMPHHQSTELCSSGTEDVMSSCDDASFDEVSVMEVLLHFACTRYYDLPCASLVLSYLLAAVREEPADRWAFIAPTGNSLLGRSVVRTLMSVDALTELYASGSLQDYLSLLELIAVSDPEGFVNQLALDERCTADVTALHAILLIPGRLAQQMPAVLELNGIRPIIESCERILIPLLRDDAQISMFLHSQVTPSPIRTLLENLFLIPRSSKGVRLTLMVSLIRVLCAATESSDPEVGRRWLEDFSLSEGPHQVHFCISEWALGDTRESPPTPQEESELFSIPPPHRTTSPGRSMSPGATPPMENMLGEIVSFDPVVMMTPQLGPADPLGATAGPDTQYANRGGDDDDGVPKRCSPALTPSAAAFDPSNPLPCAEDKLVYELLCLLIALPDDGSLYHNRLYEYLLDTARVTTYLSTTSPELVADGSSGRLSTLFEDRVLPSSSLNNSSPAGLQLGMRVLVHACRVTSQSRPALCHFLSRVVVTMLSCRGQDLVDQGLVTTELCEVLSRLVYRPASDEDASAECGTDRETSPERCWASRGFLDLDPEHNNEYLCYVSTVITLFAKCCRSSTSLMRQEDGGAALARIVVNFIASKKNLISCAAIKTVMFHAISASPFDAASSPSADNKGSRSTASGQLSSPLNPRTLPPRSPNGSVAAPANLDPLLSGGSLLYNRLIHAGLAMTVASELMSDATAIRRRAALLELLQDISSRCPSLQSEFIPLSTNLLQLMRTAAGDPQAHTLLPRCSAILAGLRIGKYDKPHIVCQSLLGMICAVDPTDARTLVAASWALQTLALLVARERVAQEFCRDHRHDLFQFVLALCTELHKLWNLMEEQRQSLADTSQQRGGGVDEGEVDDVVLPAPGETPIKKPVFFRSSDGRPPAFTLGDDEGPPPHSTAPAMPTYAPIDLCEELNKMFAFHRQRRDVPPTEVDSEGSTRHAPLPYQYLLICDVLTLTLHLTMVSHCLQQSFVAEDSMTALIHGIGAGPMLKCRLFTSIVTRCLIGLSCFATTSMLSEVVHVGKISMLSQPPPTNSSRVTLQDLTRGWNTVDTIGDQLYELRQHRIVRPHFVRCLLELLLESTPAATIAGFELVVSVVELLYHVFHSRMENLYVLSMCGAWDAAVCQLVRISTVNPKLRSLCVHVISNAMRLFGLHGLTSIPVNCHLLLCFNSTEDSSSVVHDNVSRVFSSWEWLLNNCLPCRVPLSFFSLAFGCECSTRQQRIMNVTGGGGGGGAAGGGGASTSTAAMKKEVMLEGGVDIVTNFEVWKYPVDTHVTAVLWVMVDTSSTHKGDFVLCSLHFDGNRVVVELCGDAKGNLFISVKNRKMGEIFARRVMLGKLPIMPNKQWTMLYFTMENFASKSHASLRSKFSVKFTVGMLALHGNHHFFETVVETPDVDISQSLREKSLSTCTMLTHVCVGGLHRQGDMAGQLIAPTQAPTAATSMGGASSLIGSPSGSAMRRTGGIQEDDGHPADAFLSSRSYLDASPERILSSSATFNSTTATNFATKSATTANTAAPPPPPASPDATPGNASHQLFFASMALFQGELSSFDSLVLFALGPDALTSMDFLDKTTVINLYPILARLTTDSLRTRVGPSLALLASMWLRRQEPTAHESSVPQFTGYFPFGKASRERVIFILGAVQGDLTMLSRSETAASSSNIPMPTATASLSDLSMALTSSAPGGAGGSLAAGSGGSHNASTLSPQSSFAPNMMLIGDHSFAMSDKQNASTAAWSGGGGGGGSAGGGGNYKIEFLLHPKTKPIVQIPLEILFEDINWRGGILWEDEPQFLHRPVSYTVPPVYSNFEAIGGLQMFLWLATVLEPNSAAHVLVFQCACTWLSLHYDKPMSDAWSGESSKSQDMTLLSGILHHRIPITSEIARCITKCAGYPVLARIDFIPLLLDFSLWARDADALNVVTSYLSELQVSSNSFSRFNVGVLRYRRVGERHDHHVLEELLLHLHMKFAGSTTSAWDVSTIPGARNLVALLCTDVTALTRIAASAAWLTTDDDPASIPWTLCLLDAAIAALSDGPAAVMPANPNLVPTSLISHLTIILRCNHEGIRLRGLQCFVQLRVTLIPYLPEVQQLATIAFINDQFHSVPPMRRAMLMRSFCADRGLDDPFTSLLLYALAETLERSDRSLEVGDGSAIRGLVEFLIDIVAYPFTQAALHGQLTVAVEIISTVTFSILNIFVDSEDIGLRSPTPLFHCARRHILNILCACLRASELQIHSATSPAFVDGCVQLFELVSELTTLLYIPSTGGSDESPSLTTAVEAADRSGTQSAGSSNGSTRGSQNHETPMCEYFTRCVAVGNANMMGGSSSSRVRDESSTLSIQRWYRQLLGHDRPSPLVSESADFGSGAAAAVQQQKRAEEHVQFSKSQPEVVPLYALELSSRLHAVINAGLVPVCIQMDKHRIAHKCSLLHQQQLRLITFLLTIETRADDGQQEDIPDTHVDQLQTLCLLHTYYVGPQTFGVGLMGTTPSAQQAKNSKPPKTLLKVPPNARWSEDAIHFVPESLFATSVARYKEPTIAILSAAVRFLSHVADPAHRKTPLIVNRATLGHNICRAMLYFAKPVTFKKDLTEYCVSELERFSNEYMSVTSTFVDSREQQFLERLPLKLLTTHGQAAMQGHTTSIISRAVARARQNLRVDSSRIPLLDPQRAVDVRNRIDGGMQKLQASTMKRAAFYEKTVDHDSRVILAVNAAYRFSMQPWWGPLATLHTDQRVALNRYELDRFTGPDWERSRLRRFAHEPKMLAGEGNAIRFQLPLTSVVAHLQAHQYDRRPEDDDMEMLSLFGVTAVPQSVHQRVLMQSESASHRCLLILPMDRVPVILTLSHVGLLIRAEIPPPQRSENSDTTTTKTSTDTGALATTLAVAQQPKAKPRGTLVRVFSNQQQGVSAAPSGYRYKHEMHDRVVPMSSIRAVWPRRNLLQQVAIELLLESGDSLFLSFSTPNERKAILEKISHYAKQYLDKTLIPNQNNLNIWRTWWSDGRISNFKYLMYLNFCAGRSYGDVRQYPVFPHVVGQYQLDTLDLTDPTHFRLLDKPMGAQIPEKEAKATQLYESLSEAVEMSSDSGNGGSNTNSLAALMMWHYGTHYAPLACVLQSLVRVQPFGDYFLDMNSKLDEPDRVFESMANTYSNYTGTNSRLSKDVREMVPEFYCLPEMLRNTNEVPFGVKQDGSVVDHVQLPPWTQNPRAFVVSLREALECQHTSERLHLWLDLVFGFKQRGKEAVAAINVYHPLTYEKTVDLSAVDDAVELKSHITQIDNFGQTPVQLFTRNSHKPRCKPGAEFHSIPCPTLRYEHAFAKSSVLLFPERLVPTLAAPSAGSQGYSGGGGGGPLSSNHQGGGGNSGASCWIVFCRSPIANAALGADELGDFFLSTNVVSRSVHHVLPLNVLPFTVVADAPKDYIVVRSHTVSLVDAKDLGKDLASARITKALTTVAAVQPPFAFIGSTCGAIHVVEVRFDDIVEVDVNVLPFTVVADAPKDYIVVRSHTVSLVDAKDLGKDLASARITKALTTVAAVQPPFAFIGSTCGAIHVVEVRFDDIVEVDVPQPPGHNHHDKGATGARPRLGASSSSASTSVADVSGRWSDLPDGANIGGAVDFFSTSFDVKTSKVKSPQIKLVDCLYGHHGTIVSLTVASEWGILVSAAQDWVLAVWDLHRRLLIRTIPSSDLRPQRPISLFHQRILSPWSFVPSIVSVNPTRGDVVVAGLGSRDDVLLVNSNAANSLRSEVRVFTINGELAAMCPWRTVVTALVAMGPVIFVADGRALVVLDSVTLSKRQELHHHALEDSIVSIAVNPYGTCVSVVDKAGNVGSWKVSS